MPHRNFLIVREPREKNVALQNVQRMDPAYLPSEVNISSLIIAKATTQPQLALFTFRIGRILKITSTRVQYCRTFFYNIH